jgi:hypothetical protein
MHVPSIGELSKLHLFILTYPFRVLFIPAVIYIWFTGDIDALKMKLLRPRSFGHFLSQLPFRILFAAVGIPLSLALGSLDVD